MYWTELPFSKYKGKTLPQVIFTDPDWFFHTYESIGFRHRQLAKEADDIYRKARSIRIPGNNEDKYVVEYIIHPTAQSFDRFHIISANQPPHQGASPMSRERYIDFLFPKLHKGYDKSGYRSFISDLQYYYFGDPSYRMTKDRCEAFFENEDNFL